MMDQITQTDLFSAIVKQSPLNESQLNQMVSELKKTYSYENETHILKLIAQEYQVEVGNVNEYLYTVLKYENGPITFYFIPFTTIFKTKIKEIIERDINNRILNLKAWIKSISSKNNKKVQIKINTLLEYINIHKYTKESPVIEKVATVWQNWSRYMFTYSNDVLAFFAYCPKCTLVNGVKQEQEDCRKCPHIVNETLEDMVGSLKIDKIVQDYRIIHANGKKYIPISILPQYSHDTWNPYIQKVSECFIIRFPYISLEPFEDTLMNENVFTTDLSTVKNFIKWDSLKNNRKLKTIHISEPFLEEIRFHADWKTPLLERVTIQILDYHGTNRKKNRKNLTHLSLKFLQNSPKLKEISLNNINLENIDFKPLENCQELQKIEIINNEIREVELTPLQYCTNLISLDLSMNKIKKIDFTPLQKCTKLRRLTILNQDLPDREKHENSQYLKDQFRKAKLEHYSRMASSNGLVITLD